MGASESKISMKAPVKPEPSIKKPHLNQLGDPRSPSNEISRTPIQVGGIEPKALAGVKSEFVQGFTDPRSPTMGIIRTPVREVMRATIGSFAQRLSMLFHSEAEGKVPKPSQKHFTDVLEENPEDEDLASSEPLLSSYITQNFGSLAVHTNLLTTPVRSLPALSTSSPFFLLEEVEIETEPDITLDEAEEAKESPLHKRLSMSLITCHEGATSSQIFAEAHIESTCSPKPSAETCVPGQDHSYAIPSVTLEPESPEPCLTNDTDTSPVKQSPVQPEEEEKGLISLENMVLNEGSSIPPESCKSKLPPASKSEQPQVCTSIRYPTFDVKSPSQVELKPQWLGKGFGAPGLRARRGKGNSSPLAVSVAVRNAVNENKGHSGKRNQKGTDGRSPLQILGKTNSPQEQRFQMKPRMLNQDKQRLGLTDHRVQALSQDKENR